MTEAALEPIIDLTDLSVSYRSGNQIVDAVKHVSLAVAPGEVVAIVGESGSGKSTLANALIGLLSDNAEVKTGTIRVGGEDMTNAGEGQWRALRGRVVGLVPQDPMVSLNPTMRIGRQIGEAVERARGPRGRSLDADVLELLEQVGIDQPVLRARQYPHELSGGMRQRVLIAIAIAGQPELIIADEPTSALDATVQRRILDHLDVLVKGRGISMLIITHDLGVAADRADRVLVMQAGRIVEQGPPASILRAPAEPYTRALIAAAPALRAPLSQVGAKPVAATREILRFEAVSKVFALPGEASWFGRGPKPLFQALDRVSFSVHAGQTLAIVGESGSGKTTSLRIALGLDRPTSGRITFEGRDITGLGWNEFRPLRRRIQLIQQNPFASLDPRYTVFESIIEPLQSFGKYTAVELQARARQLVDQVRLPRLALNRLPRELSGGQRQRVAIARALALGPELLFLDEPVSALDVSIQAQILDLLGDLQRDLGMSYVLVSHDLAVVSAIAHQIVVLRGGRVVEHGAAGQVFGNPQAAYTRELLEAIPGRVA
jgi:peptide/nickel transport system ATP-binding protein